MELEGGQGGQGAQGGQQHRELRVERDKSDSDIWYFTPCEPSEAPQLGSTTALAMRPETVRLRITKLKSDEDAKKPFK
jgi:hypothetical protein